MRRLLARLTRCRERHVSGVGLVKQLYFLMNSSEFSDDTVVGYGLSGLLKARVITGKLEGAVKGKVKWGKGTWSSSFGATVL